MLTPFSSEGLPQGSVLLPFSMGHLRNNTRGCPGGKILTLPISPCQGQTPRLPRPSRGEGPNPPMRTMRNSSLFSNYIVPSFLIPRHTHKSDEILILHLIYRQRIP